MGQVLLTCASRALADTPAAVAWAKDRYREAVHALGPRATLLTGDAVSDAWALAIACGYRDDTATWEFRKTGEMVARDGTVMYWTDRRPPNANAGREPWKRWLLERDAAIVKAAREWGDAEGVDPQCLALVAPWSRTNGTRYTARLAGEAGFATVVLPCPAELGPAEAPR
jgi:hypothetical protein